MKSGLPSHIILSLAISSLSGIAEGATVVKSGAKCGKLNSTAIYKGIKFNCVKSGKN
jgi:hypothetical protein